MRFHRPSLIVATCLLGAACDVPTDLPIIDQRWVLPLEVVTLEQDSLLPDDVRIVGSSYEVDIDPVVVSEDLGNLCPACISSGGVPVPIPAFMGSFVSVDALPPDVAYLDLVSGSIDITITNGLSFDPIASGGSIAITVSDDTTGDDLGVVVFDGATDALPPMGQLSRPLVLSQATVTGSIRTTVDVVSTGTQFAPIDVNDQITLDGIPVPFVVSEAGVEVNGTTVSLSQDTLDVEDLDETVTEAIEGGTAVLDVTNPFGVTFGGTFTVGSVTKNVAIPSNPTSQVLIAFTGDELRSFLGQSGVTISGSGTLGGGPAVVTPADRLEIDTSIDLTVRLGG